ncbi:unannotated protein [freshwater metagenome]|uniref:Prephenate dehydrogenase n=1 Tax=freshwater metagenome TaxID=449393 RepID=A0A6J7XVI4_9ZZZZ|nr:prephenate dehydrogenase [Actinomycetota bacterium]
MGLKSVRIIGSGLIGTSIGLALSAKGVDVEMVDSDEEAQALAQELVGYSGEPDVADLIIIAVPIGAFKKVIKSEFALNPNSIFIDISSVKTKPLVDVSEIDGLEERFCFTHPMAGREVGGAQSARGDLFASRPWIITPTLLTSEHAIAIATEVAEMCSAITFHMPPAEHDKAVALVSHLPQILASLLAKALTSGEPTWLELSGQGLRDMTRLAGSSAVLWEEILSSNASHIRPLLISLQKDLTILVESLNDSRVAHALIEDGNKGRERIPGKHGGTARDYTYVPIVIQDKPGQLAALFNECAVAGVNVEDLTIEHTPGQFTGLVTLAILSSLDAYKLTTHLSTRGWSIHASRNS